MTGIIKSFFLATFSFLDKLLYYVIIIFINSIHEICNIHLCIDVDYRQRRGKWDFLNDAKKSQRDLERTLSHAVNIAPLVSPQKKALMNKAAQLAGRLKRESAKNIAIIRFCAHQDLLQSFALTSTRTTLSFKFNTTITKSLKR